jgi:hypothetical protein
MPNRDKNLCKTKIRGMNKEVERLFEEQICNWEMARNNYATLEQAKIKTFELNGCEYRVQFNPARIISSSAKVDEQSIRERKCFLCRPHLPPEQKAILFKEQYLILVNPYPIFPRHLTIPACSHRPQRLLSSAEDLLDLARELDDYLIFYNGPRCGASAPDHFHFQAGSKGFLPIEKDWKIRCPLAIESDDKRQIIEYLHQIHKTAEQKPCDNEPMLNLLAWYDRNKWIVCLFLRKKHRPACYTAEGEQHMLISPASVDMGGVWVTPLEKDFDRITATDIETILQEVCLTKIQLEKFKIPI